MALPTDVSGLMFWWDASQIVGKSDGDGITQWDDSSGNARHITGTGPTYQTNEINTLPAVQFDGVDDFLVTASTFAMKPVTIFALVRVNVGATTRTIIGEPNGSGLVFRVGATDVLNITRTAVANIGGSSATITEAVPTLVCVSYDASGNYAFFIDGVAAGSGTNDQPITTRAIRVGMADATNEPYSGLIADVAVYDSALSTGDRQTVESYFVAKWLAAPTAPPTLYQVRSPLRLA